MIPRTRFDVGWRDLLYGIRQLYSRGDRLETQRELESFWSPEGHSLASLSLRSGFDVAVGAYAFPPGSEVLMSCMNIQPMADIVQDHGLVPVPIDLDIDRMTMRPALLEEAVNEKTCAIVHAHLLGARGPLDELREFADRHGLVLFEDCAQAYRGDGWRGDPRADVTMFSFGPLKTCSATMGGIARYRDPEVLRRARARQAELPVQGRYHLFDRLIQFAELLFITQTVPYTVVVNVARRLGLAEYLNTPVRNFRGRNQMRKIRKQPHRALLALMLHRLKTYDPVRVRQRIDPAEALLDRIPDLRRPGRDAADPSYWLFPICCDDPVGLRKRLHQEGFDSTLGHKAFVVLDTPPEKADFQPVAAAEMKAQSLYLPIHFRLTEAEARRLADLILDFGGVIEQRPDSLDETPTHADSDQVDAAEAELATSP